MNTPADIAAAAGTAEAGPSPQNYDQMVALQQEQARQMVRVQRVNVAFSAMDKLTAHAGLPTVSTTNELSEADQKLWNLCVATISDFLRPSPAGMGTGPRIAE